jgi:hypothetical protein
MLNQLNRGGRGGRGCLTSGIILLAVVALGIWLVFSLGRTLIWGRADEPPPQTQDGGDILGRPDDPGEQLPALNRIVTARNVDNNGCAVDTTDQFAADEPIYVVVPRSLIPSGTELFVRLSDDRGPVEDTDPIRADREMDTCVWFVFEPEGRDFAAGRYRAELFVNGQSADRIDFDIAEGTGFSGSSGGAGGQSVGAGLERVLASYELDQDGCVAQAEDRFRPNDDIYISAGPAFIPGGTQLEARLLRDGDVVEQADPITASDDMNTCVYFAFEATGSGFAAGDYEGVLYVNGDLAGTTKFSVR